MRPQKLEAKQVEEEIEDLREPIILANILVPPDYVGAVLKLCTDKRGAQKKMLYLGTQVSLQYALPMAEVVLDFFDRLKSVSRGYASFDYEFSHFASAPLVKLDILINAEKVDALSIIVHRDHAYHRGRYESEIGEDRIAPAYIGFAQADVAEFLATREDLQL